MTRQGLKLLHLTIVLLALLRSPALGSNFVERVFTFTPDGKACVDCDNKEQEKKLAEIVAHRLNLNVAKWLFETVAANNEYHEREFRRAGVSAAPDGLVGLRHASGGVTFRVETAEISYETVECWIPDCYKHLLSMRDSTRRWRWRRRVPSLELPVHPLLTDHGVMIVASKGLPGRS